jgi:hypothetical protein
VSGAPQNASARSFAAGQPQAALDRLAASPARETRPLGGQRSTHSGKRGGTIVLGIDFGTSNSAAALIDANGAMQVVPLDGARAEMPTAE